MCFSYTIKNLRHSVLYDLQMTNDNQIALTQSIEHHLQACALCPAGTSSTTAGMSNSSCLACSTGYISSQPGSTGCVGCTAGRFATDETNQPGVVTRATICSDCEAGCVIIHEHSLPVNQ